MTENKRLKPFLIVHGIILTQTGATWSSKRKPLCGTICLLLPPKQFGNLLPRFADGTAGIIHIDELFTLSLWPSTLCCDRDSNWTHVWELHLFEGRSTDWATTAAALYNCQWESTFDTVLCCIQIWPLSGKNEAFWLVKNDHMTFNRQQEWLNFSVAQICSENVFIESDLGLHCTTCSCLG